MRIAQVSPLYESVPPRLYGGTERAVSYLTEELVRLGHEVTLFASGDSETSAELVPITEKALRLRPDVVDPHTYHVLMMEKLLQQIERFDVVHFHTDYLHFPLVRRHQIPHVSTLHGRLDIPDLRPLYLEFSEMPLVSISHAQREPLPWANWYGTVYHGLPCNLHQCREKPGDYLAFLGRISPEKRADWAIDIAVRSGMKLKIAAKVDNADKGYFETIIKPKLRHPNVEFIGEIGEHEKGEFLGGAYALLFPIDWPEPFGLVMIEAMACGTPVLARRRGSVPEVIDHGHSGFIFETIDEAVRDVEMVASLDRRQVRRAFETRFTSRRMAEDYLEVYLTLRKHWSQRVRMTYRNEV